VVDIARALIITRQTVQDCSIVPAPERFWRTPIKEIAFDQGRSTSNSRFDLGKRRRREVDHCDVGVTHSEQFIDKMRRTAANIDQRRTLRHAGGSNPCQ
jgi:hypothetical protein